MPLEIRLLGGVDIRVGGTAIALPTRRSLLLLAMLAMSAGRPWARGKIAGILWCDRGEAQARASLRQELYHLRRGLDAAQPPPLRVEGDLVTLDQGNAGIDVVAFEQAVAAGDAQSLERAAELYRGDLLDGVAGAGPAFEDWLTAERQRLRELAVLALDRLRLRQAEDGATAASIGTGRRLLLLDPLREDVCRDLMRLLWGAGQRGASLKQYQATTATLRRELGIEPEAETTALHRALLAQDQGTVSIEPVPSPPPRVEAAAGPDAPADMAEVVTIGPERAERRHLTVLSCELAAISGPAGGVDVEDLHEAVHGFRNCAAAIIDRLGGHVTESMGMSLVITFGHLRAAEDDAERAVRAALELVAALAEAGSAAPVTLTLRVGIATGPVIVQRADAASGPMLVGDAPEIASSLRAGSPLGSVTIADATRRRLGGLFVCLAVEPASGGMGPDALRAWRVLGKASTGSRFEALRALNVGPMLGREQELALLLERWSAAAGGDGQTVLLSGVSGIGKSRLVEALRAAVPEPARIELRYQCCPASGTRALHPFITQLERAAGFRRDDTTEARRTKLRSLLASVAVTGDGPAAAVSGLLAFAEPEPHGEQHASAQSRKAATFAAILEQLHGLAAKAPVLLVYEDAHWSDPTSLELLERIIGDRRDRRVLVVVTCRPDFVPSWQRHPHVTALSLNRLSRRQCAALATRILGDANVRPGLLDQILARTDGVPLFIEEISRAVLQQATAATGHGADVGDPRPIAIPETLSDSLLARLDHQAPDKEVVQISAVLGEFSYDLLDRVARLDGSPRDGARLAGTIGRLVGTGLLVPHGSGLEAVYAFSHALVRDAAYETMLKSRRRQLHALAAAALEAIGEQAGRAEPVLLAYHWTKAGQPARAVPHRLRAGRLALERSAMGEAATQLTMALEAAAQLADLAERQRLEAELNVALGVVLAASQGTGAVLTGRAYGRAVALCEATGDLVQLLPALYGMIRFHVSRRELDAALALAERAVADTVQAGDATGHAVALYASGWVSLALGRVRDAEASLGRAVELLDSARQCRVREACGIDLAILARVYLGWCALAAGRPEEGRRLAGAAVAEAEALGHPLTLAATLDRAAMAAGLLGRATEQAAMAQRLIEVGKIQCFPAYVWKGELAQAWAEAETAQADAGGGLAVAEARIARMRAALEALHDNGDQECGSLFSAVLAGPLAQVGRQAEAEDLLLGALARVERTGERCFECEIRRCYAAVLLRSDRVAEARAMLKTAITMAREQEAPWWELLATRDLTRLYEAHGEAWGTDPLRSALLERLVSLDAESAPSELRVLAPAA